MANTLYTPHSIRTFTGKFFDFTVMDPDTICIEDIAHALAHEPRFSGHTPQPYSVAKHSITACMAAPEEYKLEALLHDATEAYMKDIAKPLKSLLPDYCALEDKLAGVIAQKFGLQYPMPVCIKDIDKRLLESEYQRFFEDVDYDYDGGVKPEQIKKFFIEFYEEHRRA